MNNTSVTQNSHAVKSDDNQSLYNAADLLSTEDKMINAVVRFHHAKTDAQSYGRQCMQLEQMFGEGVALAAKDYHTLVVQYRKALAEMSAARYDLVTLLGW